MSAIASFTRSFPAARAAFCSALAASSPFAFFVRAPLVPRVDAVRELPLGEGVAPVAEGPLGELHDVALVHEGQALPPVGEAYSIAARTRRSLPSAETGFMPIAVVSGKRTLA